MRLMTSFVLLISFVLYSVFVYTTGTELPKIEANPDAINGKLIFQSGKFNYFHSAATYDRMFGLIKSDQFVTLGGFIHLFYNQDKNNLIVISYKTPQAIEQVTLFSYVFIFFSATVVVIFY